MQTLSRSRYLIGLSLLCGIFLEGAIQEIRGDTLTINSGSSVTFLDSGSDTADFASVFTPTNFLSAQGGSKAFAFTSTPRWFAASAIPGAVWIGTNSAAAAVTGDTALYAASFTLPSGISTASLSIQYGVDNALGDKNAGIYINGTALPGSTGIPCGVGAACGAAFSEVQTYSDANVTALLNAGPNWIYFDDVNFGAPAGLIFSATVTYTTTATPEPSTFALMGFAAATLLFRIARFSASRRNVDKSC